MDDLFSLASEQYKGKQFMDFLLDSMPLYAQATYAPPHELPRLTKEFTERFCTGLRFNAAPAPVPRGEDRIVTHAGCPECGRVKVVLDKEVAGLVCSNCGLQGRTGFDHPYQDVSFVNPSRPYTYQANKYLQSLMDCMQGFFCPPTVQQVLPLLREDLRVRGICNADITPSHTYCVLRRCKYPKLLRHRWRITQLLNPEYVPLHIPHDRQMAVLSLFAGCYQQFTRQQGTGRRNFYSYPLFLKAALHFIGCSNLTVHFTPLKNRQNELRQLQQIERLLNELLGGRPHEFV